MRERGGFVAVVGDEQDGRRRMIEGGPQVGDQVGPGGGVQPGERLVEQQYPRPRRRELGRWPRAGPRRRTACGRDGRRGARSRARRATAGRVGGLAARRIPRSRRPAAALSSTEARCRMGRCSTAATAARSCVGADRLAVEEHLAARGCRLEAGERPQQRRLPGTVRAEHGHRLAVGDLQEVHREQLTATVRDPQAPAADAHDDEDRADAGRASRCWARVTKRLTAKAMASSTRPNAMARANWPRLVASTAAVVSTRVSPCDVPADHLRGAHLAHHRTEAGQAGREQRQPRLGEQRPQSPAVRVAPSARICSRKSGSTCWSAAAVSAATIGVAISGLGDDHRGRGVEQPERAERAAAPQQHGDEQPDHHRRQAHPGVGRGEQHPPAREPAEGQRRAERHPEQQRHGGGGQRDPQGQRGDRPGVLVAGEQQPDRLEQPVQQHVHRSPPRSRFSVPRAGLVLARVRGEQRLPELGLSELADLLLRRR